MFKSKQFNTPNSSSFVNTDENIHIHQTPTLSNYHLNTLENQSDDDVETSFTRHGIPAPADLDSEDEDIFDIRPKKIIKSTVSQTIAHKTENLLMPHQAKVDVNNTVKSNQPSLIINNLQQPLPPEESSIANSDSDSENTSGTDTFNEIYDSHSESNVSSLFQDENEAPEDQWTDILTTDEVYFTQNELKSEIKIPPNVILEEPLDYYKLFVTEEVFVKMVAKSNKHAAQYISLHVIKSKSRLKRWEPTTFKEMQMLIGRFIVIDETMIPWKGRLNFRQYIKNKAHKYGIKLYKLCTPEGYTYSLMVYTGKDEENSGAGHGYDVVLKLTKNLLHEGRTLIADNFYTSVSLAEELLKRNTYLCGTVRTNRKGLPKTVISTKLKKEVIGNYWKNEQWSQNNKMDE
ncbi:unnamed protein product [Arctia plantaginis]|uniref:PiggyBac transposable element-derived protein domain-containing protein n=1 Tax=Arctia plantaginis TaxID=874455 RepID=A0A8S1B5F3_ARCPL|nr:unnamed protein product [Arctia plantaginis]